MTGYSSTVSATLAGPSRLSDDGVLATASLRNSLGTADDVRTSVGSSDGGGEESVGVGSGVVGGLAESRVGNHGVPGVDGDNRTGVASSAELRTSRVDSVNDGRNGGLAGVDELVADGDSVEVSPVAVGESDDLRDGGAGLGDVVDTSEDLHALGDGGRSDGVELVAVDTVKTDHRVATEAGKVGVDLASRLASAVGVVGRVGDANAAV